MSDGAGYEAFRDQLRRDILAAYAPRPPGWHVRAWRTVTFSRHRWRKHAAWSASLDAATIEARHREAEYAAALPGRMAEVADQISERFADVLPEGMRFEWVKTGD